MALASLIDRINELRRILAHWDAVQQGASRLVLVRGRRQVGKTFLLAHCLGSMGAAGRTLFHTGLPGLSARQQLDAFAHALREQLAGPWLPERLDSWAAALRWLAARSSDGDPHVLVLDEAPYVVGSDPGFPGALQQFWDEVRRQARPPRLLIVLTGSSVATMTTLTSASGAIYGRADDELVVDPFDLPTAATVLSELEPAMVVEAYAACGGYPFHLRSWNQKIDTAANLQRMAFAPGGLLLRNGGQLIADVPDEGGHRRTLHAIGTGAHQRKDIQAAIDQRADRPLDLLGRATLISHRRPIGAPDRLPGLWRVVDSFLQCWYELCWADREQIEAGLGEGVARAREGRWQRHLGWVFEEQARAHAARLAQVGGLPADARYGEWWSVRGAQAQIDVLGMVGARTTVIGEAKAGRQPLGRQLLEVLKAHERVAPDPVPQPVLVLWSRGGIDDDLRRAGVRSYTADDMVQQPADT